MGTRRTCEGITRRDCLQFGLGGLLAGGLVQALRAAAPAGETAAPRRQADSCILIWMDGGPTHYETFDPKPEAPVEIRGEFEAIETRLPGVHFSQHLPRLARDRRQAWPSSARSGTTREITGRETTT